MIPHSLSCPVSLVPLVYDSFYLAFFALTVLRKTGQVFSRMDLSWGVSDVFSQVHNAIMVWGEEYHRGEMPFSSHPTWGSLTSTRCHWGVNFDHLVKVMFARFLRIKVTIFLFPYTIVCQWVIKSSLPSVVGELPEIIPLPPEAGVIGFVFLRTGDHSAISDLVYNLPFLYIMWGRMCLSSCSWSRD